MFRILCRVVLQGDHGTPFWYLALRISQRPQVTQRDGKTLNLEQAHAGPCEFRISRGRWIPQLEFQL